MFGDGKFYFLHRHWAMSPHLPLNRRPSNTNAPVTPEELQAYRASHQMLGPCCFCPLLDLTLPDFVESAMYRAVAGKFSGKYIATCTRGNCKYISECSDMRMQFHIH